MQPGLNAFRAFAFLAVYLFHQSRFGGGYIGVTAFFVLSGFLLTPILVQMKAAMEPRSYFRNFYGRRFLRIFPLYYFYLAVVTLFCVVVMAHPHYDDIVQVERFLEQLPWAATFTFNFYHASALYEHTHLVTHFWSLAVEEQFYLFWPVAILLVPARYLRHFLLFLVFLGPLIRMVFASDQFGEMAPFFTRKIDVLVYVLPKSHLDAFAIGGYFALFVKSRSAASVWGLCALVLAAGVVTEWYATGRVTPSHLGYSPFMRDSYKYIWGYSALNLMFAWMLVHVRDRKFLPALFENRGLDYLGRISYGLYVYHFGLIWLINLCLPETSILIRIPFTLVLTVAVSALSYEYLEKRFIAMKDRFFENKAPEKDLRPSPSPA